MEFKLLKAISAAGKEYYGLFMVNGDYKVLIKFLTKNQFDKLTKKN